MKKDVNELKRLVYSVVQNEQQVHKPEKESPTSIVLRHAYENPASDIVPARDKQNFQMKDEESIEVAEAVEEESFSLEEKEKEVIIKALQKNHGKRKGAARDLGISERTLYRKLKEYNIDS